MYDFYGHTLTMCYFCFDFIVYFEKMIATAKNVIILVNFINRPLIYNYHTIFTEVDFCITFKLSQTDVLVKMTIFTGIH